MKNCPVDRVIVQSRHTVLQTTSIVASDRLKSPDVGASTAECRQVSVPFPGDLSETDHRLNTKYWSATIDTN